MPTDVVMPQMGESIAEGTIVRWIKKVGDTVARDEPLFEISTDKVDAEIPSPAAGVVSEIRVQEGETVPVNSVVAVIAPAGVAAAGGAAVSTTRAEPPKGAASPDTAPAHVAGPRSQAPRESQAIEARQRSSPLVHRIAREHHVDIADVVGTGIGGRVTKQDILDFIAHAGAPARTEASGPAPTRAFSSRPPTAVSPGGGVPGQVQPMSLMRKKIAEHMVMSQRTSAHVHSVFEVNFSRIAQIRAAKHGNDQAGAKLTYLSFIIKAVADALRVVPVVNASIDGDNIVYHRDVNVGIAVALDWGLIVPVITKADERDLGGLSRAVADLASRARSKQLKPDDVLGGTFTITNPGVFGALAGMPIINQPQVAILAVGQIEKRPVVIDDAIVIRPMAHLTLGYDHRLIDGVVADQFMARVKHTLENWDPAQA